jgi:hypothetical protein
MMRFKSGGAALHHGQDSGNVRGGGVVPDVFVARTTVGNRLLGDTAARNAHRAPGEVTRADAATRPHVRAASRGRRAGTLDMF